MDAIKIAGYGAVGRPSKSINAHRRTERLRLMDTGLSINGNK